MKKIRLFLVFLFVLTFSNPTLPINITPFLSAKKITLENRIRVIYKNDLTSKLTIVQIFIKGGTFYEPSEKSGLAFLTTRLSSDLTSMQDIIKITTMGSKIFTKGGADWTTIKIECLSENFEKTIKIFSKSFTDPLFSGIRINGIKNSMKGNIKREEDEPFLLAEKAYSRLRFGNEGYGNPIYGTEKSLKLINKKDVKEFYKKNFWGQNIVLVVVTDLYEPDVIKIIKKYFKKIPKQGLECKKSFNPPKIESHKEFIKKERKLTLITISYPLSKIDERSFALSYLLNVLMGKGIYSRLWKLRQEEKLAYTVMSKFIPRIHEGTFYSYIETPCENKEKALKLLKNEFKELREKGISEAELKLAKINSKVFFLRENETKSQKAYNFGFFEIIGLGFDYPNRFFEIIDDIKLDEINNFVKKIFSPEKEIEIIIGKEINNGRIQRRISFPFSNK